MTGTPSKAVAVRFTAKGKLRFGQDLFICGAAPELGSWWVGNAVTMEWAEGDHWSADVTLPHGVCIEFKLVIGGNPLTWLGVGANGDENLVLETSLCRKGGQGSRLLHSGATPLNLEVADLKIDSLSSSCEDDLTTSTVANVEKNHEDRICLPADSSRYGESRPHGNSKENKNCNSPETKTPQTHDTAAMLAGACAAKLGRRVTYQTTTTTTTTSCVTIDGDQESEDERLREDAKAWYTGARTPAFPTYGDTESTAISDVPPPKPGTDDDSENSQVVAFQESREQNAGLARVGVVPLAWRKTRARKVEVAGSWDGWCRRLALEPLSDGSGFGLLLGLPAGQYECKFIVDGVWTTSDEMKLVDGCQFGNNVFQTGDSVVLPSTALQAEVASTLALTADMHQTV